MAVINLTESRIRDLEPGSGIWRDEQVKGLMVVCHATTKTYAVQGDVRRNGRHVRTVRVKIDRVDRIGLREARNRAKAIMSQIQSGIDPTAKPEESGITIAQALDAHLGEKTFREATIESLSVQHRPLSRPLQKQGRDRPRAGGGARHLRTASQQVRPDHRDRRHAHAEGGDQHGDAHGRDDHGQPRLGPAHSQPEAARGRGARPCGMVAG
ncbi:integrase arm-type DNA-binding domain-containing protein [Devosia algicola]|uniref:Integrase arm-type DNA-binding domain-containing protein n=1 Tax=Devosia algicola TaxID=3026418 RepID=A0ABY7YPU1_9HYPH|nr:integrase arm-type DNA-binding domain-containing protein [Devosia algicola]WDR03085.1 integrase arm-type DNA-binding domain-containing protein [Devosia algicola]